MRLGMHAPLAALGAPLASPFLQRPSRLFASSVDAPQPGRLLPLSPCQVTLITRDVETPYSGMLPGHVAGFYTREECHLDLGRLAVHAVSNIDKRLTPPTSETLPCMR